MTKKPLFRDLGLTTVVYGSVACVSFILFLVLFDICVTGGRGLDFNFLFSEPISAGRSGGIAPILVSTGFILLITMVVSLPLGLGSAILLSEFSSEEKLFGRLIRRSLDVLAGVPSICFGLFGNAFFCKRLGLGFSILSGGLTLACMVLPILIRSTEEGFRSVPKEYRLSAAALSLSRLTTLRYLLLPAAMPGFLVGFVLGVGRALAETAALIFTSGYVDRFPRSMMDSGRALSIHIYDLSMNISGGDQNAYRSAFVLVVLLLVINFSATWVSERWLKRKIVLS